jgi:hypothetical protein
VEAPRCARKSRSECALDERAAPRQRSFARPTEPAGAPYEVGRRAGPACPELLTAKSFARWASEPSSRLKPSVRPPASAPTSAPSGRIEATLARFVRRGRDRRLPQHRMGLILAGACPTHRRSAKAKGLAVASHRAAATSSRPSAPLPLVRAGSSTMPPRPLHQEEDLRRADQMWPADRLPATFRFLHRESRCRLFPPRRDFSANSKRRDMAAPAASLSLHIDRGGRDKIGPADNARRAQARRR